jgi:hypothetical protein
MSKIIIIRPYSFLRTFNSDLVPAYMDRELCSWYVKCVHVGRSANDMDLDCTVFQYNALYVLILIRNTINCAGTSLDKTEMRSPMNSSTDEGGWT